MNFKKIFSLYFLLFFIGCGVKGDPKPKKLTVVDFTKVYEEKVSASKPKVNKKDKKAAEKNEDLK